MYPASAAAPKNAAVTIPSMLPLAFHTGELISLGMRKTEAISIAAKNPSTSSMVNVTIIMSMSSSPLPSPPTSDVTTDSTAMASMSSTTAAPMMSRASGVFILPNSLSTWIDMAMLVAVRAVAIIIDWSASNPNACSTTAPRRTGPPPPASPP